MKKAEKIHQHKQSKNERKKSARRRRNWTLFSVYACCFIIPFFFGLEKGGIIGTVLGSVAGPVGSVAGTITGCIIEFIVK